MGKGCEPGKTLIGLNADGLMICRAYEIMEGSPYAGSWRVLAAGYDRGTVPDSDSAVEKLRQLGAVEVQKV